jgi:splicing factor U2AF 65 kDa subunit
MGFPNISDPHTQTMLNVPFSARTPSRIVQILNMCSIEDLMEEEYYKDLYEDVNEEAIKFGNVLEIDIPRPDSVNSILNVLTFRKPELLDLHVEKSL